jgi:lipopolysaccharide export system permease protein
MRILSKYIIKELIPHFFLSLLAFTFLLLSGTIIELTAVLITKGIDYSQLLLIISNSLPPLLVLTIPMALLLSLLVGLGRLSSDFEIIIMRNLGLSSIRLFLPVLLLALTCWLASSYFMISLTPIITILGRKAAYENRLVTWDELVKDEQRFVPKLTGLKD